MILFDMIVAIDARIHSDIVTFLCKTLFTSFGFLFKYLIHGVSNMNNTKHKKGNENVAET